MGLMRVHAAALICAAVLPSAVGFINIPGGAVPLLRAFGRGATCAVPHRSLVSLRDAETTEPIVSPFDPSVDAGVGNSNDNGPMELTLENVEKVLDTMRPYLMSDGGNVRVSEIDGGIVRLKLEGACGTCPSSTMTMKMGLERGLREKIPEIVDVVQDMGEGGPALSPESVETVLDTVRPFLNVAGGTIELSDLRGVGGMQPVIILKMGGKSAALRSVKTEIMQRLQRNFMIPGLRIDWASEA